MTREEKEILLKDLSARLPYKCKYKASKEITHWHKLTLNTGTIDKIIDDYYDEIKPYLRPMSSMTEEERKEIENIFLQDTQEIFKDPVEIRASSFYDADALDWYLKKHFDYRKLIEKGLAIEAPEGMYESKNN